MLTLEHCIDIKDVVRDSFKRGHKSSNKVYVPRSHELQGRLTVQKAREQGIFDNLIDAKHRRRFEHRKVAGDAKPVPLSMTGAVQLLEDRFAGTIAGNCGAMAIMALGFVAEEDPGSATFYCGGAIKGYDHAFCMAIPNEHDLQLRNVSKARFPSRNVNPSNVNKMKSIHPERMIKIIDPWLNIACEAEKYPENIERQLEKWDGANKRILWLGSYWRPTDATYKNMLLNLPIAYSQFDRTFVEANLSTFKN